MRDVNLLHATATTIRNPFAVNKREAVSQRVNWLRPAERGEGGGGFGIIADDNANPSHAGRLIIHSMPEHVRWTEPHTDMLIYSVHARCREMS